MKIVILARWYSSTEHVNKIVGINTDGVIVEGIEDGEGLAFNLNTEVLYVHPAVLASEDIEEIFV